MKQFNQIVETRLIEYAEKEPSIQDLANDVKTAMKADVNVTDEKMCWPHLVRAVRKIDFLHPVCQASEQLLY